MIVGCLDVAEAPALAFAHKVSAGDEKIGDPGGNRTPDACTVRLRPILMTAILTMVVLIPVAVAPKTRLDAYQPLAVAVVGELTVGTILSLFVIPSFTLWLTNGPRA